MIGQTLAHYQITGHLGKGGMGEVYRARDTKLDRDVALKMLPPELGHDLERRARFEREARTLASLQHPNVASIYGFEEAGGHRFLVMELAEGHDLTELIAQGPLPVDQALEIALQIARGLEAAHEKGIVHRDLKPANVKISAGGDVKILDFGLARAYADEPDPADLELSPTITAAMTRAGVILGTAAYMSPEQARGRPVDRRTDVWAFGVVLYEMLTADRLFGGETVSDSIGAILHREPDFGALPPVPGALLRLLRRCLERDPRRRLRDIGDAILEVEDAMSAGSAPASTVAVSGPNRISWIVTAVAVIVAAFFGWRALQPSAPTGPRITSLGLPETEAIDPGPGATWNPFDISPDGKQVVYMGGADATLQLRSIDSFEAHTLDGTEGAFLPVFSPDGKWIAYGTNNGLWKVAVSGGAPIQICATETGPGLAWRGTDELVYAPNNGGGLWAVSAAGGTPRQVSTPDPAREEASHRWPWVLPDQRHALMVVKTARITTLDDAEIALLDLDTQQVKVLIQGGTQPRYVEPGFIVYARKGQLFAVHFDLDSLTVEGTPRPVLDDVRTVGVNGSARYAVSDNGTLAYIPGGADMTVGRVAPVWVDRSGRVTPLDLESGMYYDLNLSRDGRRLAMQIPAANDKVWVYDLDRRTLSRVSNTPGNDVRPVWSPDGASIAYSNDVSGTEDVFVIPSDGSEAAQPILASEFSEQPRSWSPDGRYLSIQRLDASNDPDIWILDMQTGEARPFVESPGVKYGGMFSPNGRAIAYSSEVSGDVNVYVRPFPGPGSPTRISRDGGFRPRWSFDGSELYFESREDDPDLMVATISWDPAFSASDPKPLLTLGEDVGEVLPTPDPERFLALRVDLDRNKVHSIRLVFDWVRQLADH